MAQAVTTDTAIASVRDAILRLDAASQAIWPRAAAEARGVVQRCEGAVVERRTQLAQIIQALQRARDEEEAGRLQAMLQHATRRLQDAEAALRAGQAATAYLESARRAAQRSSDLAGGAVADLRSKLSSLDGYVAGRYQSVTAALGAAAVGASSTDSATFSSPAVSVFDTVMSSRGMTDIAVDVMHLDRPDLDRYPRGGLEKSDFAWAAVQWEESVRPGLEAGLTRDDFAAQDATTGASAPRSLAEVHDLYLGTDCIWGDRRADGGVDIRGGQHRVHVAREMAIRTLPVRLGGSR
jgi:vacuolar-type H+-ATPase subunit E/Vma4